MYGDSFFFEMHPLYMLSLGVRTVGTQPITHRRYLVMHGASWEPWLHLSPKRTGGPLATTSDLLISLESSDEEEDTSRRAAANNRRSLPRQLHQQQPQQHSNSMRRIGSEGQVSTRSGGLGGGGRGNMGGGSAVDVTSRCCVRCEVGMRLSADERYL